MNWMIVAVAVLFFITGWLMRDLPETAAPISEVQAYSGINWEYPVQVLQARRSPEIYAALCDTRHHKPDGPSDYVTFQQAGYTYIYNCKRGFAQ